LKEEFYISLVGEAFDGYTKASFEEKTVYIKHVSIRDQRYLHNYYEKYKEFALSKGLPSEEYQLQYVRDEGIWNDSDELSIENLKFEIKNLKQTARAVFLQSQKEDFLNQVEEKSKKLISLQEKRKEIVGQTAESYAEIRSGDEILRFLLFKNKELTNHLYSEEEFGELESWQILTLSEMHRDVQKRLTDSMIQKAVLRPFFNMYLSLCEDVNGFYGKPITELTIYQLRVVLFGRMFYNIFQYTDNIPDHIKDDPEKLLSYSESQRNGDKNSGGIKDDSDASAVFGATAEDMKNLKAKKGNVSLSEEAEKAGGKLDMKQMMRLAGHDV
tara:strand:+ start:515 stop:1498 length:984 start_codon:yes stop_codon:yes gene_type:complete